MSEVLKRDEAVAQATALADESINMIAAGDYDKAQSLAGMALEMVINACGETAFEACKFYYYVADSILCKIETSTEILNDAGPSNGVSMDDIAKSMEKLPEVLTQSAEKMKELFAQMAQKSAESKETTDKPSEPLEVKDTVDKGEPNVDEEKPELKPMGKNTPDTTAPTPEAENCDQDNPKVEDEEEEEIITTTKNPRREDSEEEEKGLPNDENNDEEEYAKDEFRAPWENLEVALHIFHKTLSMHENPEEFEQNNWNLKADILERQADLEVARENTKEAIELYRTLIDLCVKHNCDRAKSRTIAGILFKIGCAYSLLDTGFQAALDNFHEAANILGYLLIEDIKLSNPEYAEKLSVHDLKIAEKLEKLEVASDKSMELQSILKEINDKIEECTLSISEKPLLDKEKQNEEKPNTFKKPVFEDKPAMDLGSFGKGKKRTHNQVETLNKNQTDDKDNANVAEPEDETKDKASEEQSESNKRQKVDEEAT